MKHLGDITKISGYDAPTVNVIIGGSPCQDLSVAGKRAGLSGERSGLFMEQIRIIKEMRDKDAKAGRTGADIRPRFMVWENVPGVFSVNKGRDFAAVLEETIRVAEPEAPDIPVPCKGWTIAGCFMGDGWSVAWRVLDAQYWGVPQRRRRIALVADFGGQSAPEILFKPKSLSGHFEPCGETRQGTAGDAKSSIGTICIEGNGCRESHKGNGYAESDTMYTLNTVEQHSVCYGISAYESNSMKSDNPNSGCYVADTSRTLDNNGGNPACNQGGIAVVYPDVARTLSARADSSPCVDRGQEFVVYENHSQDSRYKDLGNTSETVSAKYGTGGNNQPLVVSIGNGQMDNMSMSDIANTLDTMHDQQAVMITAVDCRNGTGDETTNGTLQSKPNGGTSYNLQNVCRTGYTVRRLTPMECERLQGYPDGFTDIGEWIDSKGKKRITSDSARYKALGNSIAIPPWLWVCDQIGQYLGEDKTMASLFDGIGGFPLIWSYLFGKENIIWCSEVDDYCNAVTERRFGNE